jgi:hypothetical protein
MMATVLVQLSSGEGVVRRDNGDVELCADVSQEWGQPVGYQDRYEPASIGLSEERCLVGGLLPPGASQAEVVDDRDQRIVAGVADGAYAAVLDQPNEGREVPVCFRDADGMIVRRPLAGHYPATPVTDTEEPCPACHAIDYEECVPTESWRGGRPGPDGTTIPGPIVVCRRCGHQESEGTIMRFPTDDEDEAVRAARMARVRAEQRVQRWYSNKLTLRAVTFPIYAAEGWYAQISGSGSRNDEVTELTISHSEKPDADLFDERSRLEITTSTEASYESELAIARMKLRSWVHDDMNSPLPSGESDAAVTLQFRAADRRRRAAALNADRSEVQISIEGVRAAFLVLIAPGRRWVAVRRHDDLTVTVTAHDVDPGSLVIEPIADPAARLLGPEPEEQ